MIDTAKLWYWLSAAVITVSSMMLLSLSFVPTASAAACDERTFLGLPAWYKGLTDTKCNIKSPGQDEGSMGTFVWRIALNIIEALMMLVGYASVVMIIIGGFFYITATGQADKIKSAKGTILNAVIGLVIALSSVAAVNIIARML